MSYINPEVEIFPVHATLWQVKNIFTDNALDIFNMTFNPDTIWKMDRPLARLSFDGDLKGPISRIGEELATTVGNTIGQPVEYRAGKVFIDLPGSEVPRHFDDTAITVMAQFYIGKYNYPVPGTLFLEPFIYTVPYEFNCGYINLNADKKMHQSPFIKSGIRTSVGYQFI